MIRKGILLQQKIKIYKEIKDKVKAKIVNDNHQFAWETLFRLVGITDGMLKEQFDCTCLLPSKAMLIIFSAETFLYSSLK